MPINNSTNRYSNSRYVVDNVSPGCPFTTIQSAINAAVADGGNAEIWVRQGTYTENLMAWEVLYRRLRSMMPFDLYTQLQI
jgi:pectin methylesterase-like acyl-CoA thioesterase